MVTIPFPVTFYTVYERAKTSDARKIIAAVGDRFRGLSPDLKLSNITCWDDPQHGGCRRTSRRYGALSVAS